MALFLLLCLSIILKEANPPLKLAQLGPHLLREAVAHLGGEVGPHLLNLLPPEAGRGGEKLVNVLAVHNVKKLQLLPAGNPADGPPTCREYSITTT